MNLRWLLGNFTDPQYHIPRREQFQLSNIAHARYLSHAAFWWRTALILLPVIVSLRLIKPTLAWLGYAGQTGPYLVVLGAIMLLCWPWSAWMYRSLYVRPVRRAMREAGYDLCLGCGYELRGLDGSITRCPECGEERSG